MYFPVIFDPLLNIRVKYLICMTKHVEIESNYAEPEVAILNNWHMATLNDKRFDSERITQN